MLSLALYRPLIRYKCYTSYASFTLDEFISTMEKLCFRYIERLKSKNERLNAALERRRVESEQNSVTVRRLEADCASLQKALRYW